MRAAIVVVVLVVAALAWALVWPAPRRALTCRPADPARCAQASGRVVYLQSLEPGRAVHAVLLSRSSLSAPLLVVIKLPVLPAIPKGMGRGHWVSVVGARWTGSHGEDDIHVVRLRTADGELRCRWQPPAGATGCR